MAGGRRGALDVMLGRPRRAGLAHTRHPSRSPLCAVGDALHGRRRYAALMRPGTFNAAGSGKPCPHARHVPGRDLCRRRRQARVRRIWCQGMPPWLEADRPSSMKPRRA